MLTESLSLEAKVRPQSTHWVIAGIPDESGFDSRCLRCLKKFKWLECLKNPRRHSASVVKHETHSLCLSQTRPSYQPDALPELMPYSKHEIVVTIRFVL